MNATKPAKGAAGPAQLLRLAQLLQACGVGVDLPAALWSGAWTERVEEDVRGLTLAQREAGECGCGVFPTV